MGARIELLSIGDDAGELAIGDCGVVESIAEDGHVIVLWDRGFALEIDPDVHRYRKFAA